MTASSTIGVHPAKGVQATVRRFVGLAVRGLPQMLDERSLLFCYRMKRTEHGLVREGLSPRYTLITLMGLHRLQESGRESPIPTAPVLESLLANLTWIDNVGDLGLLLWLCALAAPERLAGIEQNLDLAEALTHYRDAREGRTMELAWFLTGLCYFGLAVPEKAQRYRGLSLEIYQTLRRNQGESGIFGHLARNGSIAGCIRGWLGSFADQVYPIYAMTCFSRVHHSAEALQLALRCARVLCETQGPDGEWWWHYSSSSGSVREGYPVFSVHQHGMGPMALFALGEASRRDFSQWISKGLQWINSRNALQVDMEAASYNLIWRSMEQPGLTRSWDAVVHSAKECASPKHLKVLYECRPYELGWLLYALANRAGRWDE